MLTFLQYRVLVEDDDKPFGSAEQLKAHYKAKHPGVDLQFHDSSNHKHATLSMIHVPKEHQGKGIGSHIMKSIGKYADHHGKTVSLSPEKRPGGPSKSKLTSWYKDHGFVSNKGRHKDFRFSDTMIRHPKVVKEDLQMTESVHKVLKHFGYDADGKHVSGGTVETDGSKWKHSADGKTASGRGAGSLENHLTKHHQTDMFGGSSRAFEPKASKKIVKTVPAAPDHSKQLDLFA